MQLRNKQAHKHRTLIMEFGKTSKNSEKGAMFSSKWSKPASQSCPCRRLRRSC